MRTDLTDLSAYAIVIGYATTLLLCRMQYRVSAQNAQSGNIEFKMLHGVAMFRLHY